MESGQMEGASDPRETTLYKQALEAGLIQAAPTLQSTVLTNVSAERKGSGLDDQRQCVLQIDGMWCSSCSWLISQALLKNHGVVSVDVSFASDTARVVYMPAKTDESALARSINQLGYFSAPLGEANDKDPRVLERRREFLRLVIAFAFAMNIMMMQLILYAGYFEGIASSIRRGLPWLLFALSLPVIYCSRSIYIRAFLAASERVATMETLVALGSGSALVYSIWQTVRGSGHVYFDTADMLLGLVMLGKFIETGVRQSAKDALTLLYGLLPKKAVVICDGREAAVSISQLCRGDTVRIRSGERIPTDGKVESGSGMVDESLLSGEPRPVHKRPGDALIGGAMLQTGVLTAVVERTGEDGMLSQIIQLVQNSLNKKTAAERLADRISRVFVPLVLLLALCAGVALYIFGHASIDVILTRIVAVLVIACPCALGIATPMAISAGVAYAAQSGILVADGGAFETLSDVDRIVLDKTGTATEGKFEVRDTIGGSGQTNLLLGIERNSPHPIASAIVDYCSGGEIGAKASEAVGYRQVDGVGIFGLIDGRSVFAGNARAVAEAGLTVPPEYLNFVHSHAADGLTLVYWGVSESAVLGVFALGDKLRPSAGRAVETLSAMGITADLVSGDSPEATGAAARKLNIESWLGGVLPSEKAVWIESLIGKRNGNRGKICMVGDGINDAPALARADVGIALASGTDVAARTAQVTLLTPDLTLLPLLIKLSKRTVAIVRQNLFWAFLYNIICIPLAMAGMISPIWAVSAMLISSLTVLLNTQRLKRPSSVTPTSVL